MPACIGDPAARVLWALRIQALQYHLAHAHILGAVLLKIVVVTQFF
jgi:hypothetical protein